MQPLQHLANRMPKDCPTLAECACIKLCEGMHHKSRQRAFCFHFTSSRTSQSFYKDVSRSVPWMSYLAETIAIEIQCFKFGASTNR